MNERKEWGWLINNQPAPQPGQVWPGDSYTWWRRGATDEHFLEIEGLDKDHIELLNLVKAMCRARPEMTSFAVAGEIAKIMGWQVRDLAQDEQEPEEVNDDTRSALPGS